MELPVGAGAVRLGKVAFAGRSIGAMKADFPQVRERCTIENEFYDLIDAGDVVTDRNAAQLAAISAKLGERASTISHHLPPRFELEG